MLLLKPVNLFPKRRGALLVFMWDGAPACARVVTARGSDGCSSIHSTASTASIVSTVANPAGSSCVP